VSYGYKAVIPYVSGLAVQRPGQSLDVVYPPGTPLFGATYVPFTDFDNLRWLVPERPPGVPVWHYWLTRTEPNVGSRVDTTTVDPLLRDIVAYAHSRGIFTLPSCQGHFFDPAAFEAIYRGLVGDAEEIRAGTLLFRDTETGKLYQPRLPDWVPPEKEELRRKLQQISGVGRLGFSFPDMAHARYFERMISPFTEATSEYKGNRAVVAVVVRGQSPEDLRQRWQGVYTALRRVA
jgi:hypothetical protein